MFVMLTRGAAEADGASTSIVTVPIEVRAVSPTANAFLVRGGVCRLLRGVYILKTLSVEDGVPPSRCRYRPLGVQRTNFTSDETAGRRPARSDFALQ